MTGVSLYLEPCDLVLVRSPGFLSRLIRRFTQKPWEQPSQVNHVGMVVVGGQVSAAELVEALGEGVVKRTLEKGYANRKGVEITVYRPLNLSEDEIKTISAAALGYVGKKYGWGKIAANLLDWVLFERYIFRRLCYRQDLPICSTLVASCFAKAGKKFGVESGCATPDDIMDFVSSHPEFYQCEYELQVLKEEIPC